MALRGTRTFVGFGFGAIQSGLFLLEAYRSGHYKRLVVAYRRPDVIRAVRENNGVISVNVADPMRQQLQTMTFGPVELLDVNDPQDRTRIINAVADADDVATALSSVQDYVSDTNSSVHVLLAEGLGLRLQAGETRALSVFAAENHHRAAETLRDAVLAALAPDVRTRALEYVQFVNTVIGKMCGVVNVQDNPACTPVTPFVRNAFLVEAFNDIWINTLNPDAERGFQVFHEADDLQPFEEAKLYGHNAAHACAAFMALACGLTYMPELKAHAAVMTFVRNAFLHESGTALKRKYAGRGALFTDAGFEQFVDDLLMRMTSPLLRDACARVARDVPRKLGWHDRLIGTMRLCLSQHVNPRRYALTVAVAKQQAGLSMQELELLWAEQGADGAEQQRVIAAIDAAQGMVSLVRECDFAAINALFEPSS